MQGSQLRKGLPVRTPLQAQHHIAPLLRQHQCRRALVTHAAAPDGSGTSSKFHQLDAKPEGADQVVEKDPLEK